MNKMITRSHSGEINVSLAGYVKALNAAFVARGLVFSFSLYFRPAHDRRRMGQEGH